MSKEAELVDQVKSIDQAKRTLQANLLAIRKEKYTNKVVSLKNNGASSDSSLIVGFVIGVHDDKLSIHQRLNLLHNPFNNQTVDIPWEKIDKLTILGDAKELFK